MPFARVTQLELRDKAAPALPMPPGLTGGGRTPRFDLSGSRWITGLFAAVRVRCIYAILDCRSASTLVSRGDT
jgi:hypothetical protein